MEILKSFFKGRIKALSIVILFVVFACIAYFYSSGELANKNSSYLNLNDTVSYVGMETCKQCHNGIHESFSQTGMGKSFGHANREKSAGNFNNVKAIYDSSINLWYKPLWIGDSLFVHEYRLKASDTVHSIKRKIQYIIGSGQHTNSHLFIENGYLFQAPLTFYTQDQHWDLPPGFEKGNNSRFNRIIGLECISCHNGYPKMVSGSENKYVSLPNGIDCERCHGPGEIHVAEKRKGLIVDTSKYIDYTIVNPGKLSIELQFDLCQRCHLQGNAVLKEGKSFFDFKPGMHLSDIMQIYLPRFENDENSFIMASHADRLKQSNCFIKMAEKAGGANELRPYKNALTCVTCHNPHVSVKQTNSEHFIQKCQSCHSDTKSKLCSEKEVLRIAKNNNCISCHMPVSGSIDIPHVRIHDHYIRKKPEPNLDLNKKKFVGLSCINDPLSDSLSKAQAYLQQFEKFNSENVDLLDSAAKYLQQNSPVSIKRNLHLLIQLNYLKQDFNQVIRLMSKINHSELINEILRKQSWSNRDAWTAYRIGESYSFNNQWKEAELYYGIAFKLAPYYFEFANKFGTAAMNNNNRKTAKLVFTSLIRENPLFAPGWSNYGYVRLLEGFPDEAEYAYKKAIALNMDYVPAQLNLAGLYLYRGNKVDAKKILIRVLELEPKNSQAKEILTSLDE